MSLLDASDSVLDRAEALYTKLYNRRVIPEEVSAEDGDASWGELRSVCDRALTGAELWHEWCPLFEAFTQDRRDAMLHYMHERWTLPIKTMQDLEQSFVFEVLRANIEAMRAKKLRVMKPALGEQGMQAWEQKAGVKVAEPLRTFVVHVSAGDSLEYETGMFDFSSYSQDMSTFEQSVLRWYDPEHPEPGTRDALDILAGVIELFATSQAQSCSGEEAIAHTPPSRDVARDAIVVGWYFEGNHGDWIDVLITRGALAGSVIRYHSLVHSGGRLDRVRCHRHLLMPWLHEQYHLNCLGEDVWGALELDIEL